ncbi:carboxypeptidase Y-deficient [Coemansia aciculifera]|uniref:Carboxypeptidase Y-deficient n=1 Tax=Coemansia aciculifera TaxID=417176 RepID=A0A9W8ILD2_9FUNG|nr:carboxypeptidase Y-deficient [Coemansia aciculifera]KAJ2875962.1 carboxypeptidase Y-deficient [Coemansia aciculifera]
MHLDEMHSDGTRRVAQQDDLDDVADAILGFFRGAGKAVRGLGTEQVPVNGRVGASGRVVEDGPGVVRSLTAGFMSVRRAAVSAARLEDNRVERRIERLALAHGSGDAEAEQRVVAWEPDGARDACPLCARRFGRLAVRRHHCRICGRLVCGSCTTELDVGARLRMCGDCGRTVARIRSRQAARPPGGVLAAHYEAIRAGMADADRLLPAFNRLLGRDFGRAAAMRGKLTRAFGDADRASKLIAALPADSPTDARLHAAIRRAVVMYLQTHMFTLSMVPSKTGSLPATPKPASRSASIDQPVPRIVANDSPPPVSSSATLLSVAANGTGGGLATSLLSFVTAPRSTRPVEPVSVLDDLVERALDADPQRLARLAETPLEEKLASLQVLRDQRQRVLGYISEAQRERRLEDLISLQASLNDLDVELSIVERNL